MENKQNGFGDAIGFGGLDRPTPQEHFDVDVLRVVVKTLNAARENVDLVINTGDSLDIETMPELIAFLAEMNNLDIPWFQTIGNHDRLGLGNIPPELLDAFSDLDFVLQACQTTRQHHLAAGPRPGTQPCLAFGRQFGRAPLPPVKDR